LQYNLYNLINLDKIAMEANVNNFISVFQQNCWKYYKRDVNIPETYTYLYGNPVKVHVPVDTACGGIMIIGAYPTAHFNTISSERDVPVGDHLYPFSNEKYFDGSRIREVDSGRELEELFLKPLAVKREVTWITDLVKIFLFKEGHQNKYERLGFKDTLVGRKEFDRLAKAGLPYIFEEINLCGPKVILGLGAEVNATLLNESIVKATSTIQLAEKRILSIGENNYNYFACPHPGILMREDNEKGKWKQVLKIIIEKIKLELWSTPKNSINLFRI